MTARDNASAPTHYIHIIEPDPERCISSALPPEGNIKQPNYRLLSENICAYTPINNPSKNKLTEHYDICATISPPRAKILELLRPEDPGRDALEAIVRPAPRRGLIRPLDEDTRRFLHRALQTPSPLISTTPESQNRSPTTSESEKEPELEQVAEKTSHKPSESNEERSLAEELEEAEEERGGGIRREILREWRKRRVKDAVEREQLGKLALSVEEDEVEDSGLTATARRIDALLAESRGLHDELAEIHEDLQVLARRVGRRDS